MSSAYWTLHKCYSSRLLSPDSFSLLHLKGDLFGTEGEILLRFIIFLIIKLDPYTIVTLKHI